MKICIVSRSLYPLIGGSETYVYNLGEHLRERGHEVVIVTSDLPSCYEGDHCYPFEVLRVPGLSEFNSARAPLSTLIPLYQVLHELHSDVIHVQNVLLGIAVTLLWERLPGSPAIVFTDHNTPIPQQSRWISGVNCYDVELALGEFMFKHGVYDVAVAPSQRFYDWALSRGAPRDKVELIRHGVDVERFSPGIAPGDIRRALCPNEGATVLLAPGRVVRRKGIMTVLDAVSSPLLAPMDVHLAITTTKNTSEPDFLAEVRNRIKDSGLRDRVTLLVDRFTPDQMPDVYRASDCVLFPSSAEGFGLVGIEALSSGVPLIARYSTGIDEYLVHKKTGWALQGDSSHEIASAVRHICQNDELRASMARAGRRLAVSQFSLSTMIRRIEDLYFQVAGRKKASSSVTVIDEGLVRAGAGAGSEVEGWS